VERRGGRKEERRGDIEVSPLVFKRLSDENLFVCMGDRKGIEGRREVGFQGSNDVNECL